MTTMPVAPAAIEQAALAHQAQTPVAQPNAGTSASVNHPHSAGSTPGGVVVKVSEHQGAQRAEIAPSDAILTEEMRRGPAPDNRPAAVREDAARIAEDEERDIAEDDALADAMEEDDERQAQELSNDAELEASQVQFGEQANAVLAQAGISDVEAIYDFSADALTAEGQRLLASNSAAAEVIEQFEAMVNGRIGSALAAAGLSPKAAPAIASFLEQNGTKIGAVIKAGVIDGDWGTLYSAAHAVAGRDGQAAPAQRQLPPSSGIVWNDGTSAPVVAVTRGPDGRNETLLLHPTAGQVSLSEAKQYGLVR